MILETVFHVVPLNGTFCLLAVLYILIQLDVVQHELEQLCGPKCWQSSNRKTTGFFVLKQPSVSSCSFLVTAASFFDASSLRESCRSSRLRPFLLSLKIGSGGEPKQSLTSMLAGVSMFLLLFCRQHSRKDCLSRLWSFIFTGFPRPPLQLQ